MQKWEYVCLFCKLYILEKDSYWSLTISNKVIDLSTGLKQLGEWGYELVGIQPTNFPSTTSISESPKFFYIFKRPIV